MSDLSEELKKIDNSNDNVCRDYIRGMCDRRFCRFKHENDGRSLSFCHDFQNTGCPRPTCKFIHCSAEEVEEYKQTGEMSNQILVEASRKNQLPGIQPICNLFKKGVCRRQTCKFRHITKQEEDVEIMELIKSNQNKKRPHSEIQISESHVSFAVEPINFVEGVTRYIVDDDALFPHKRRFVTSNGIDFSPEIQTRNTFTGYCAGNPPTMIRLDARTIMLEEENSMLQKEIAQLKKQVSDLTATNEFLLDQNATLRVSGKRTLTVTMPTATITNTMTHNTPSQQQQVLRTVASVAAVPVSLATVTTCNPVSVSPVSIAGCPSVSITPTTQILAPSQQILVTTNQPTQLALAANSSQAQLAIAQQNLANNLAAAAVASATQQQQQQQQQSQASQPQPSQSSNQQDNSSQRPQTTTRLTLTLPTTAGQQQAAAAAVAIQQAAAAAAGNAGSVQLAAAQSHLTSQAQQLGQQLTTQAQQLGQQLTTQAQQLALANSSQAQQQLALANTIAANAAVAASNTHQQAQLTSQAQQLALANTPPTQQHLTVASMNQQLALATTNCGQLLAAAAAAANTSGQAALDLHHHHHHRAAQVNINTSQTIAMSQAASQPMVSYPLMTQTMSHPLSH